MKERDQSTFSVHFACGERITGTNNFQFDHRVWEQILIASRQRRPGCLSSVAGPVRGIAQTRQKNSWPPHPRPDRLLIPWTWEWRGRERGGSSAEACPGSGFSGDAVFDFPKSQVKLAMREVFPPYFTCGRCTGFRAGHRPLSRSTSRS